MSEARAIHGRGLDWNSILVTFCTVVGTVGLLGGAVYALGWNGSASVAQITALNTLVLNTATVSAAADKATNLRIDALQKDIDQRRTEAANDQTQRHNELLQRLKDGDSRVDGLVNKLNDILNAQGRLAASFCYLSKQVSPTQSGIDCTRMVP